MGRRDQILKLFAYGWVFAELAGTQGRQPRYFVLYLTLQGVFIHGFGFAHVHRIVLYFFHGAQRFDERGNFRDVGFENTCLLTPWAIFLVSIEDDVAGDGYTAYCARNFIAYTLSYHYFLRSIPIPYDIPDAYDRIV